MVQEKFGLKPENINWTSSLGKYLPLKEYSRNEKLNSLVRLSLYISLSSLSCPLILTTFVLIGTAFLTYLVYISHEKQEEENAHKKVKIIKI